MAGIFHDGLATGVSDRCDNYWDYTTGEERIAANERFLRVEPDMDRIGEHWGMKGVGVICCGDHSHMRSYQEKRRKDALSFIGNSLPIWC